MVCEWGGRGWVQEGEEWKVASLGMIWKSMWILQGQMGQLWLNLWCRRQHGHSQNSIFTVSRKLQPQISKPVVLGTLFFFFFLGGGGVDVFHKSHIITVMVLWQIWVVSKDTRKSWEGGFLALQGQIKLKCQMPVIHQHSSNNNINLCTFDFRPGIVFSFQCGTCRYSCFAKNLLESTVDLS